MIQQAYGRERLSQAQVFRWHKMFKEGRESVEEEPHAGRPSTSRTTENEQSVRHMLLDGPRNFEPWSGAEDDT
ncbi:UNVERIFIED_CONTAM: hypothetical protein NCL1_11223 [Trichonephila clavipes]